VIQCGLIDSINYYLSVCLSICCEGIAGSSDGDRRSRHGYDRVFAVNYLGHFLLVNHLLPLLVRSAPSRVVSVTSIAHSFVDDDSLFDARSDDHRMISRRLAGYDASKLAMVLHVKELSRRLGGLNLLFLLLPRDARVPAL